MDEHNAEHDKDLAWLKSVLAQKGETRRIVVATHYAPAFEGTSHPMHKGSEVNQCFASNAFDGLQILTGARNVTHWVFGHTHWNARFRRGKTLVVSNQLCNTVGELSWWQRNFLYRLFDMHAVIEL